MGSANARAPGTSDRKRARRASVAAGDRGHLPAGAREGDTERRADTAGADEADPRPAIVVRRAVLVRGARGLVRRRHRAWRALSPARLRRRILGRSINRDPRRALPPGAAQPRQMLAGTRRPGADEQPHSHSRSVFGTRRAARRRSRLHLLPAGRERRGRSRAAADDGQGAARERAPQRRPRRGPRGRGRRAGRVAAGARRRGRDPVHAGARPAAGLHRRARGRRPRRAARRDGRHRWRSGA